MKRVLMIGFLLHTALSLPLEAQPQSERGEAHWKKYDEGLAVFVSGTLFEPRRTSRLFYWYSEQDRSGGEIFVSHGSPEWSEELGKAMESLKSGLTWRLGSGFWTLLDTSLRLNIGGTRLEPGLYYLGVNRSADGEDWRLAFLSPRSVRRMRMNAYETHLREMPVEKSAPLQFAKTQGIAKRLRIFLDADKDDPQKVSLEINFGPYRLNTAIQVESPLKIVRGSPSGRE